MVQQLIAIAVGIVGVCLTVVGAVLLQVAIGEWRLGSKVGELAPAARDRRHELLRPTIAAVLLVVAGVALITFVVVAELT